jgi:hypothetical protein
VQIDIQTIAPTCAHSPFDSGEYRAAHNERETTQERERGNANKSVLCPFLCNKAQKITRERAIPLKREHEGGRLLLSVPIPKKVPASMTMRPMRSWRKCFSERNERTNVTMGVRKKLITNRSKTIDIPNPGYRRIRAEVIG